MKRLTTIFLMMLSLLAASVTPALAKHGHGHHHGDAFHDGYYYRQYRPHYVKYYRASPYYIYPAYDPYYVPAPRVYAPVVYPVWYAPPPSLFNFNLRL